MPRFLVVKEVYRDGFFFNQDEFNEKYPIGTVLEMHSLTHAKQAWVLKDMILYNTEVEGCLKKLEDTL